MKLSFKAIEEEILKNGLNSDEATLKSVSSGIPASETTNIAMAKALIISNVQSLTTGTTTTTTTTTTANTLPPVTVTGTIADSGGGGSINISVTVTPNQWSAATTMGSFNVRDLPFAAGDVTVIEQRNPISGNYFFTYSQMIPPGYSDFMSQLDVYYLLHVPSLSNFTLILKGCYAGYSDTNVALYQIDGTNNFAAYNLSVAIDNDGDPSATTVDPYVVQYPVTGYYPTSLKTGLSGQDNNLDASKTNYLALSSAQRIIMDEQMGDYVAVTNNDPKCVHLI